MKKIPLNYPSTKPQNIQQMLAALGVMNLEHTPENITAFEKVSLFDAINPVTTMRAVLDFLAEHEHSCDTEKHVFIPYTHNGSARLGRVFFTAGKKGSKIEAEYNLSDPYMYSPEKVQFLTGYLPTELVKAPVFAKV